MLETPLAEKSGTVRFVVGDLSIEIDRGKAESLRERMERGTVEAIHLSAAVLLPAIDEALA